MVKRSAGKRRKIDMAYAIQATPTIKGMEAVQLYRAVMTSKPDPKKIEKIEKGLARIKSYKK